MVMTTPLVTAKPANYYILGKGATATVYLGRQKIIGDQFAIKVFSERVATHFSGICNRELGVLQRIKHKNVITLLAIEKETVSQNEVLVMEYCGGGSLYNLLELPENAFGFQEEEFIIVLTHIVNGMEYLRQQGLIHRDIKPGNIMRHIGEDGRSVYKLTDFGAARELDDDDTFTSIFGTEEYLHPDMYEKAVLRHQTGQRFDSSVDLWSIGVTLYHVATGMLPFQPFGGRNNVRTMFQITSQKKSGILSGVQLEENGEIIWSSQLPGTCLLSSSLKSTITPMLARLMESDAGRRLDFPGFFKIVHDIEKMIKLRVFVCCAGQELHVYIGRQESYSSLQEKLALITDIAAKDQLILVWDRELADVVELTAEIQNYPTAVVNGQLFLYVRDKPEPQRIIHPEIPQYPDFTQSYLEKPKSFAKKCLGNAFHTERVITETIENQHHFIEAETTLRSHVRRRISHLNSCLPDLSAIVRETKKRQGTFYSLLEKICVILGFIKYADISKSVVDLQSFLSDRTLRDVMEKAEKRCAEIRQYMEVLLLRVKEQEANAISTRVGCQEEHHCLSRISYLRQCIGSFWEKFCEDKKLFTQSGQYADFIIKTERSKLQENCVKLESYTTDHCLRNSEESYSVAYKHFELLLKNFQRTKKVEQNFVHVMECMKQLSDKLDKIMETTLETLSVITVKAERGPCNQEEQQEELNRCLEVQSKEINRLKEIVYSNTLSLEKLYRSMDTMGFSDASWNQVQKEIENVASPVKRTVEETVAQAEQTQAKIEQLTLKPHQHDKRTTIETLDRTKNVPDGREEHGPVHDEKQNFEPRYTPVVSTQGRKFTPVQESTEETIS
ncbi:hypothetical protein ScPMuIL_008312 [Solemya velum]